MDQQVDLDVENLFNDAGELDQGVLQAHQPVVPALVEHILDLIYYGNPNRVAWSRQGHLASISDDGTVVNLQCLRVAGSDNKWTLSEPRALDTTFDTAVSLTWSPTGYDLAVVDAKGRVSFFSLSTASLNQMEEKRTGLDEQLDDLGQPICTLWLNQDRQDKGKPLVLHYTRQNDRWTQTMSKTKPFSPVYPRMLCMIDRCGNFIITYQRMDTRFSRRSIALPVPSASIFTHGAIAQTTQGKFLVAVHSFDGSLSIYYVQITLPPEWRSNPSDPAEPALYAEIVVDGIPAAQVALDSADGSVDQTYNPDSWSLTHLEIVPTSDGESSIQLPPSIWAVYASLNQAGSSGDIGFLRSSTIRRWSVTDIERKLHSKFNEIPASAGASDGQQTTATVDRLADTTFPSLVTAIDLLDGGQAVAISTADGRSEIWNATDMSPASFEGQPNHVTSMAQAGFTFPVAPTPVLVAFSTNTCVSAVTNNEGKLSLNNSVYLGGNGQQLDMQDPQQNAAITSIILQFSRACWTSVSVDDLIATITAGYQAEQLPLIASAFYHTICKDADFVHEKAQGSEAEKIVTNNPMVGKILSMNLALLSSASNQLSQEGVTHTTTWSHLWAWTCINARHITTHLYFFYRETSSQSPLTDNYVEAVCNNIKWCFDLYRFIVQTILNVGDRATNPDMFEPSSLLGNLGDEKGDGSQGLVALLINCQWSRTMLTAPAKALRAFIDKHIPGTSPMDKVIDAIHRYGTKKGLSLNGVEMLLDGRWYVRNGLAENESLNHATVASRQIEMMTTGYVSQHYQSTIQRLLTQCINGEDGLRANGQIQRLKLFTDTPDVDWILLGMNDHLSPSPSTTLGVKSTFPVRPDLRTGKKKVYYDVHKKCQFQVDNPQQQLVRRCVRCRSLTHGVGLPGRDWPKKLMNYMARCVCDGFWVVETLEPSEA